MNGINKNIEKHDPRKKLKILIAFDSITADMLINKKIKSVRTELFNSGRKLILYNYILQY